MTRARTRMCSCLSLTLALALLVACSTGRKDAPPPAPTLVQAPGKASVVLTDANAGAPVVLERGQALRVNLPLDAVAVNNNLDWRISDTDPAILDSLGNVFERGFRDDNPAEAGGTSVWRFKPKGPGHVNLGFELRRPRSLDAPAQTVHYDLTVK